MTLQKRKYYHVAVAATERKKRAKFNEHTIKFNERFMFNEHS